MLDDLAYAAGYLDGEGCFHITNGKISVTCETTHKPTIMWLQTLFGGSVTSLLKKKNPKWRSTYRWSVVSKQALKVCQRLAPLLKEKMSQAGLLIVYQQTMGKVGQHVSDQTKEERSRLNMLVKGEKKRVRI